MTALQGLNLLLAATLAAAAGLGAHVAVQRWAVPRLAALTGGAARAPRYSAAINIAAYLSAVASMIVRCLAYYFLAGPVLGASVLLNWIVLSLLLLELNGNVLRMPFMSWFAMRESGHPHPVKAMVLELADKWAAGFALALMIVLFCPVRG